MTGTSDSDDAPERFDVLRYPDGAHRATPAGDGARVVTAHESEAHQRRLLGSVTVGLLPAVGAGVFAFGYLDTLLVPLAVGLVLGLVAGVARYLYGDHQRMVPAVVDPFG